VRLPLIIPIRINPTTKYINQNILPLNMNKKLYEQAKENILKQKDEDLKEEIKEEYKALLFESQKLVADKEMMLHLKSLLKKAKNIPVRSMGSAYRVHSLKGRLMTMIEEKKYHKRELKELEGRVEK
jgi:hypothetical protein